jgi:hypothetical protein
MCSISQVSEVYMMSISNFDQRVKAVHTAREHWIGLIESRLKDLTGLRLSKDSKYQYLFDDNCDREPIKRSGKDSIVVFPTNLIERALGTDNQFEVWTFILGRIGNEAVFAKSIEFRNRDVGDEAEAQLESIRKDILQANSYEDDGGITDILGVFAYREHLIKLFAQVIAYHSILLRVESEDLAFVVLAHELAHAYTMAGYDINGYRGEILQNYLCRDRNVVEGLAQYYTEAVCFQLKKYHQFKHVFEALLQNQTHPYTWHKKWLIKRDADHEYVRSALLDYRRFIDTGALESAVL